MTDTDTPAAKPTRKSSSTVVDRAARAFKETIVTEMGERPYTLESAHFEAEMHRQREAAASEIEAIDAAITDINNRMTRDIDAIRQRAAAEIQGRNDRVDDLHRVLAMTARALDLPLVAAVTEQAP